MFSFKPFQPSVSFHIETRHDLQCKLIDFFYVKYNTGLKCNDAMLILLNNYLLKGAQHMLGVWKSISFVIYWNLSVIYWKSINKILIGLKDQFDIHKLLYIFYENKTCTLQLVFLLIFLVKTEQIVILTSCKTFLSQMELTNLASIGSYQK